MDFGHSIQQSVRWLPWNERSATHSESYGEKKKTCSCSIVWGPCHFYFYVEASLSSTLGWSHQSKPFFCAPQKWPAYVWLLLHFFHRCSLWKLWRKCLMFQTVDHDIDRMVRHPILYLRQMWMVDVYTFMSFFLYYTHTHYTCSCRGYGDMRHKNYAVRVVKNHALWKVSSRTKMELKRCWFWFKLTQNHDFLVSEYMPTVLPTCPRFQKGSNVLGRLV